MSAENSMPNKEELKDYSAALADQSIAVEEMRDELWCLYLKHYRKGMAHKGLRALFNMLTDLRAEMVKDEFELWKQIDDDQVPSP